MSDALTVQPGEMDQVVTLLKPTTVKDSFGQHTEYAVVANVAARVRPLRGRNLFAAGQAQNPATTEVVIYWRPDVQAHWRVKWMTRMFDIDADPIDVDAKHDVLELLCAGVAK